MTTIIHYDVLYYFYIPFLFLPLMLGYIINRLSIKGVGKIPFIYTFLLSFVPIFNISIAFVFCLVIIYVVFYNIIPNIFNNNKIFTKIINSFENRNL